MAIFIQESALLNHGKGSPVDNVAAGGITACVRVKRAAFFLGVGLLCKGFDQDGQFAWTIPGYGITQQDLRVGFNPAWGRWRGTAGMPDNVSTHLCVTFAGGVSDDPLFYFDGVVDTTTEIETPSGSIADDSAIDWIAGNTPGAFAAIRGLYEDMRLYNRVLSAGEIMTISTARGRDSIVNGLVLRALGLGVQSAQVSTERDISYGGHDGTRTPSADAYYTGGELAPRRRIQL